MGQLWLCLKEQKMVLCWFWLAVMWLEYHRSVKMLLFTAATLFAPIIMWCAMGARGGVMLGALLPAMICSTVVAMVTVLCMPGDLRPRHDLRPRLFELQDKFAFPLLIIAVLFFVAEFGVGLYCAGFTRPPHAVVAWGLVGHLVLIAIVVMAFLMGALSAMLRSAW